MQRRRTPHERPKPKNAKPGERHNPQSPVRNPKPPGASAIRNPQPPRGGKSAIATDWGGVAEWYDRLVGDEGSEYHREVVLPGVLRLLSLPTGSSVVDVACGQGVLARQLHERGLHVTGIDAAAELIRAARERGPAEVKYHVADARDLSLLPDAAFDAAACVLAIQNIHPIQPVFEHVARVLKDRGRFVLVMMHPAFRGPKETSWGWDEQGVQYRRVGRS
jgi:ubiquinone/menaquinone biosynthesis C-methylase UbiE